MLEDGQITGKQLMWLLMTSRIGGITVFLGVITATDVKQDAWLSAVLSALLGLPLGWLAVTLGMRFPGRTIVQYSETLLGKILGKALGFIYVWFFFFIAVIYLREAGEFLKTGLMPETPLSVFLIAIVLFAALGVRSGIEAVGRVNELVLPAIVLTLILIIALVSRDMKLVKLKPVLERGFLPVLVAAMTPLAWFGEAVVAGMLLPYLDRPREGKRAVLTAILLSGGLLTGVTIAVIAVFGAEISRRLSFPTYSLSRIIKMADVIQRADFLVAMVWLGGTMIRVTLFYHAAALGLAQWLGLRNHKPLVFPMGIILLSLSFISWGSIIELKTFLKPLPWAAYALTVEAGLTGLLLLVALLRRKGETKG